ncbi:MAG: hypothetical protein ABID54_02135 [Pseudomonadota bacterium]
MKKEAPPDVVGNGNDLIIFDPRDVLKSWEYNILNDTHIVFMVF